MRTQHGKDNDDEDEPEVNSVFLENILYHGIDLDLAIQLGLKLDSLNQVVLDFPSQWSEKGAVT